MNIELKAAKVSRILLVLVLSFTMAHLVGQLADIRLGRTFGLSVFDLDQEQSIPRFYSAVTLLLCSGLLFIIAMAKKGDNTNSFLYWLGLALIFLLLAITKNTAVHENLAALLRSDLHISKIQFYTWIYGFAIIIFPVLYLKFLIGLPRRTMILLTIGGSLFIVGAFGLDLIVAYLGRSIDHHAVAYIGLVTFEEVLEMGGIITIVYALLLYMNAELKWIQVRMAE